jgi:hypothetical protein
MVTMTKSMRLHLASSGTSRFGAERLPSGKRIGIIIVAMGFAIKCRFGG